MNMIGERVSTYRPNDKDGEPTGMGGVVLGDVGAALYRVALDNGVVADIDFKEFEAVAGDITAELLRSPLPPIATFEQIEHHTAQAGLIYDLMQHNAGLILEVEQEIAREQEAVAARLRGDNAELYESQRVTAAMFAAYEEHGHNAAMALWMAAGQPDKGKTFGAFQVEESEVLTRYSPGKALAFARSQHPNLISHTIDRDKFTKAVRDGKITVKPDVCEWTTRHRAKTLTAKLLKAALEYEDTGE